MYLSIYIYIYIERERHIYTYTHIHTYTYHIHIHTTYIYICIYIYIYVSLSVSLSYVYIYIYIFVRRASCEAATAPEPLLEGPEPVATSEGLGYYHYYYYYHHYYDICSNNINHYICIHIIYTYMHVCVYIYIHRERYMYICIYTMLRRQRSWGQKDIYILLPFAYRLPQGSHAGVCEINMHVRARLVVGGVLK